MTHYGFVWEGYWEFFGKFMDYFHGKTYANGKAKVRARVMIPVHFGINECGEKEFIADLKSFIGNYEKTTNYGKKDNLRKKTGHGAKRKFRFFIKIFQRFFPQLKNFDQEIIDSKDNKLRKKLGKEGKHFIGSLYPIGKMLDSRYDDGSEVV